MGRFNKKLILIIMLIGIFLLTGCDKIKFNGFNASSDEKTGSEVTVVPDSSQNNKESKIKANEKIGPDSAEVTGNPSSTTLAIQPTANTELSIYNVNAEKEQIELVTALVPEGSEITPELIVETVIESLADQSIIIGVKEVTTDKDAVIVNFQKDKAPDSNMGSGYEAAILDAIGQSLFENLSDADYKKVIYRIEGEAYSSGVFETKINEPWMER